MKDTIPPNGEYVSVAYASFHALNIFLWLAIPHGVACFIITHVGSVNSFKHSIAQSLSKILL